MVSTPIYADNNTQDIKSNEKTNSEIINKSNNINASSLLVNSKKIVKTKMNKNYAAGDPATDDNNVTGAVYVKASKMSKVNFTQLKSGDVKNIFLEESALTNNKYKSTLKTFLTNSKKNNISVSVWISCFYRNGKWIDPSGQYKKKVKVAYKVKYVTRYKYVTKLKYNYTTADNLATKFANYTKMDGISGVHLYNVRYRGKAYKYDKGIYAVTRFTKKVYLKTKKINKKYFVSVSVMTKNSKNAYHYGQEYTSLANYADVLVPMFTVIVKSPIKVNTTMKYIATRSKNADVWASFVSYKNTATNLKNSVLLSNMDTAFDNGASGFVLYTADKVNTTLYKNTSNKTYTPVSSLYESGIDVNPPYIYLDATKNCHAKSKTIINLAKSIISTKDSTLAKAKAIFNYVRDKTAYSFYYNTKKGSLKTLSSKSGNCVDLSHLLIALARAAKIPSRYVHGVCKFNSGSTYGHVWAELYINGAWVKADASSNRNALGTIKNWNTKTAKIKGRYLELSF